ncbi:MAG: hypothetical protein ACW98Y_11100 [Candidatus Thorarchaeota archaeon]|jgi:hypothetical protein
MPRFKQNSHSFNLNVIKNQRADGKYQYKATIPKQLVEFTIGTGKQVSGEFFVVQEDQEEERSSLALRLRRFRNLSEKVQREMHQAKWESLLCPYCKKEVEQPTFPKGMYPISDMMFHSCGAKYYADRSDTRGASEIKKISGYKGKDWVVIHNYHIQFGRIATDLPPDFDVLEMDDRMVHVIFLNPRISNTEYPKL